MATYKIAPDCRRLRRNGSALIKVFVFNGRRQDCISTGMRINPAHWDAAASEVTKAEKLYKQINLQLTQLKQSVQQALLLVSGGASADEVLQAVRDAMGGGQPRRRAPAKPTVLGASERFVSLKTEPATVRSYRCMMRQVERFGDAALDAVNLEWLRRLDAHMAQTAKSPNARAVYMRNLRAVFNYAIDCELTANYPFRRFRIKTVATAKRSLSAGQLRQLLTMEVEDWQRPYRDMFALSFYLLGVNCKDLMHLPPGADATGRIEFNRAKTKKLYSIKVQPEAQAIIDARRGRDYLLEYNDDRLDYMQYIRRCNHALKCIGTHSRKGCKPTGEPLFPELTTYWARHSWATIAAELDVPKETIAAALGHDMGNSTTAIYINYNLAKVDDANRRVIDYVLRDVR